MGEVTLEDRADRARLRDTAWRWLDAVCLQLSARRSPAAAHFRKAADCLLWAMLNETRAAVIKRLTA